MIMKTLKFYGLIIFSLIMLASCGDDGDEPDNPQENATENTTEDSSETNTESDTEKVRYYVKYEVEMKTRWQNTINSIMYVSDKGAQKLEVEGTTNWTATYGPLNYGAAVSLKIHRENTKDYEYGGYNHARIYVSRNQEPFVVKAESSGANDLSLSYKIDF